MLGPSRLWGEMGLFEFLFGKKKCPQCGAQGARISENRVRCPNPSCRHFDGTIGRRARRSDYSPTSALTINYRNFQGLEKTFTASRETLRRKGNHIIARVAPTGENIALLRDRIQNLAEVEDALPQPVEARTGPTARERQVLGYHKKHKSTSPLHKSIRAKYPDW